MINTVETVLFPRMKSAGALDVYNIQISENSATAVSIWSDQAAADRAMEAVNSVRSHLERPHLNWSTAMFRKRRAENGEQATEAGRDYREVKAS